MPKVGDRGKVGYLKMHASSYYRMYDPETSRIHTTRYVRWLKRWYFKVDGKKDKIVFEAENKNYYDIDSKLRKRKIGIEIKNSSKPNQSLATTHKKQF